MSARVWNASRLILLAAVLYPSTTTAQDTAMTPRVESVAPALQRYKEVTVRGDLWRRPDLSPRDRSIVTLAALIARAQTAELAAYVAQALDHGVKPQEISEIVTHLAFYAGWGQAMASIPAIEQIFSQRGIGHEHLPAATPVPLPLNEDAERTRASRVSADFGAVAPGVVQYTTDTLFRDLWLRPDLAPRDRSLVTVTALIANGQVAQIPYHLNRAMDNGLRQAEAAETLAHLAFYVGWPNVFSALPVAREAFSARVKK